jgi:hypothetical protein
VQSPRVVPAGLIWDQHRVHARLKLTRDVLQTDRHGVGTHPQQGQRKGLVRAGPAGGKQIQALEALTDHTGWTHAALIPDARGPALLAKARFVLAPELKTRLRVLLDEGWIRAAHAPERLSGAHAKVSR